MILMVICVITILVCGAYLLRYWAASRQNSQTYQAASERYVQTGLEKITVSVDSGDGGDDSGAGVAEEITYDLAQVDFDALRSASPDVCGWLQIPALEKINYPVVWRGDNEFYLHHNWEGAASSFGAIFLEAGNSSDFQDCYSIIYGHNMKDGSMFGSLKKYADSEFYRENGGVIFLYLPEETRVYQIFSVRTVIADDPSVYTIGFVPGDAYDEYVSGLKAASDYDTGVAVSGEDSIITLSTCSGSGSSARFIVHAKQVDVISN